MVAEFPALVEALLVLYLQVSVMHWHDLHDNVAWFQTSVMQHWAGTGTVWATRGWLADTALCWLATCYCVEPRNPGLPSVTVRANPGTALLVQDICQCIVHPQDVMKLFRSLELQSQVARGRSTSPHHFAFAMNAATSGWSVLRRAWTCAVIRRSFTAERGR